ncbi:keratin-associated protein 16-1-like isoform X2 [Hydractinia symbiolongicarpus]|uniref:keratin-associated protein 16-1-like isoform X2 n=1 Tax=Hydractinia symbiolongicarpus TaxID=13093 RepID=UPI0025500D05|nr:keratin-associated protein 16-1-like isoform X2 [Hydractinia symbiolongicarpus]
MKKQMFLFNVFLCFSSVASFTGIKVSKPCDHRIQCLIFPCAPNVNPCNKANEICVPTCDCGATCRPKPKLPCQGACSLKKCAMGEKCIPIRLYNGCRGHCVRCRKPVNCFVNPCSHAKCGNGERCVANYCNGKCEAKCLPPPTKPKPTLPVCKSDGSADNKICLQAQTTFCTKKCKCCIHHNGCNPFKALYTKTEKDCKPQACPLIGCPFDVCKDHKCPAGNACVKKCCKPVCEPLLKPCLFVPCFTNPCTPTKCPRGYACQVNNCNGCSAQCIPPPKPTLSTKCKSDGSSNGKLCGAAFTKFCSANCECCIHENTCNPFPSFYTKKSEDCVNALPTKPATTACSNPVHCIVDPCSLKKCQVGQKCHANYCGGCNAECRTCKKPVNCLINPCARTLCPKGTKCVDDYCKGCNARCIDMPTLPPVPTKPTPCPNPVNCFADPCMFKKCPFGQKCHANFCGGCNAECKACVKPENCVNPCSRTRCPFGTKCVNNYCNGCSAQCIPVPTLTPPSPNTCQSDGSSEGKFCPDGITRFCTDSCKCCIHPNICNPKPSLYTKAGSQCRNNCQKPDNCVDPCSRALCLVGTQCVNDYCSGCTHKCIPVSGK